MKSKTISFIGAGNLAQALIGGLLSSGVAPSAVIAANPSTAKCDALAEHGVRVTSDNIIAAAESDVVILSVKPQALPSVCDEIRETIQANSPLVVSVAAGVELKTLQRWLGASTRLVRAMPNTTCMVRAGATGLFAASDIAEVDRDQVESIFHSVGMALWVEQESQLDIITALSGSGPAYLFYFLESLQTCAMTLGLPEALAKAFTAQMSYGASRMALELDQSLPALRAAITSPNGTTQAALSELEAGGLPDLIDRAMRAAAERAHALRQEMDSMN